MASRPRAPRSCQARGQPHQPDQPSNLSHLGLAQGVEIFLAEHLGLRVARYLLLFGALGQAFVVEHLQLPARDRDRGSPLGGRRRGRGRQLPLGRVASKKGGQRAIEDGQFVAPTREVNMKRRPQIVGPAQVDRGQGREERQHARRPGVEPQCTQNPAEMQPVAGQDRAGVRH